MRKIIINIASTIIAIIPISRMRKLIKDALGITPYKINRKKYNIGEHSYISSNFTCMNKNIKIGNYCSISRDVIIGPGQHPTDRITTHPLTYSEEEIMAYGRLRTPKKNIMPTTQKPINIGNDVWIGIRAIIQDGVTIGDGAIIGAGAIVTKDIPPYAIAVGVPAKVIKYRFSQENIDKLLELQWWYYPEDFIVNLPFADINQCIEKLQTNIHLRKIPCEK